MEYLDFLVKVTGESYGEYDAEVFSSPAGETAQGTPIPDPLQISALRSKVSANPSESAIRVLGTLLFESLFTGDVLRLYRAAMDSAQNGGEGLRIQLAIEPNELSALPWELLFDPLTKEFLALSGHATLVRCLLLAQRLRPLQLTGPLRIVSLFPNPTDMPPIDIERERHVMNEALAPLIDSEQVELTVLEHPTVRMMVEALRSRSAHILYYQGHVGFNLDTRRSYFLLEDRFGDAFLKGMLELSYTLRTNPTVRLAVINSRGMSAGTLAYELVARGIPGAVATQEPLADEETATFLTHFSQAIVGGFPLDAAVSQGRRAMAELSAVNGRWASPLLVMRQTDAAMFSLAEEL
jgi:hypothetical protein